MLKGVVISRAPKIMAIQDDKFTALLPAYRQDLLGGNLAAYAQRLAQQGLAWWCEFDLPRLALHLAMLRAAASMDAMPDRLLFLESVLNQNADQAAYLAWYQRFLAEGDRDAAAVAIAAALADIWQSGDDLRRLYPWHARCHQLLADAPAPTSLACAAMLGQTAATEMVSVGIKPARQSFAACRQAAEAARCVPIRLFQTSFETYALLWAGEFSAAEVALEDAAVLACQPDIPPLAGLFLRSSWCLFLTLRGDSVAARHVVQDDVHAADFDQLPPLPWLTVLSNLIYAAALEGDEVSVEALGERMRRRVVPAYNAFYQGYLHMSLGLADLLLGRPAAALAHAHESRELGKASCSPVAQYMPVLLEVQARVDLGDLDAALALAEVWLPKWQAVGHMSIASNAAVEMAVVHSRQGQPDRARAALDLARGLLPRGEPLTLFHRPANYLTQLTALLAPIGNSSGLAYEDFPVAIRTLGGLRMQLGAQVIYERDWRGERTKSLLKGLLVLGGRKVSARELADMLWPDTDADKARNNLKVAVWRLRRLGVAKGAAALPWLLMHNGRISLPSAMVGVDVTFFQAAASEALQRRPNEAEALRYALDLYEGDFLAGDASELWIIDHRQRLREIYAQLARALVGLAHAQGELEQALAYLQRGHELDPLDERSAECLMHGYLSLGYPGKATEIYRATERALQRDLGVLPGEALTVLAYRLQTGLQAEMTVDRNGPALS